eukprot:jgi/Mesen1/7196/ME000371S06274
MKKLSLQERPRVVVIGAGIAGVVAALTLQMGANWIHGTHGSPLMEVAEKHGLLDMASGPWGGTRWTGGNCTRREGGADVDEEVVKRVKGVYKKVLTNAQMLSSREAGGAALPPHTAGDEQQGGTAKQVGDMRELMGGGGRGLKVGPAAAVAAAAAIQQHDSVGAYMAAHLAAYLPPVAGRQPGGDAELAYEEEVWEDEWSGASVLAERGASAVAYQHSVSASAGPGVLSHSESHAPSCCPPSSSTLSPSPPPPLVPPGSQGGGSVEAGGREGGASASAGAGADAGAGAGARALASPLEWEEGPDGQLYKAVVDMRERLECIISGVDSLRDLSLRAFGEYEEYAGPHVTVAQGYSKVVQALADELVPGTLLLDQEVTQVRWSPAGALSTPQPAAAPPPLQPPPVEVVAAGGARYAAHHVIVTVSLGVLKERAAGGAAEEDASEEPEDGRALFAPALPRWKQEAISRMGFGTVDKVFLEFPQPGVWGDSCLGLETVWDPEPELDWTRRPAWRGASDGLAGGTRHSDDPGVSTAAAPAAAAAAVSVRDDQADGTDSVAAPVGQLLLPVAGGADVVVAGKSFVKGEEVGKLPSWTRRIFAFHPINIQSRVVVTWLAGREAYEMELQPEEDVKRACVNVIQRFLPEGDADRLAEPRAVARSAWGTDPLFRGSYSYVAVGSCGEDIEVLAEPLPKLEVAQEGHHGDAAPIQLLFAGEATDRHHYSNTHGALHSGRREAQRVIDYYRGTEVSSHLQA